MPRRRSRWPIVLTCMFCAHASIVFFTMNAASNTPANAEPEYYDKAVAWDEGTDARLAARRLGWSWSVGCEDGTLVVTLTDRAGDPISDAEVSVVVFHRADALDRVGMGLSESAPGRYESSMPTARIGLWEVRLEIATNAGERATMIGLIEQLGREG